MEPGKKEALVCAITFTDDAYGTDRRVVTLLDGVEKLDNDFEKGCEEYKGECIEGSFYGDSWAAYDENEKYMSTSEYYDENALQSQKCSAWRWMWQSEGRNMEIKSGVEYYVSTGYNIFNRKGKAVRGCDHCGEVAMYFELV